MNKYPFTLEKLPYAYDALEPIIDQTTMLLHHTKHHQSYVNNLNGVLEKHPELQNRSLEDLLTNIESLPLSAQTAVRNNGGGVFNHNLFWQSMTKPNTSSPSAAFLTLLTQAFKSFEDFKQAFKQAALSQFGSGWAWLVKDQNSQLSIVTTANQDTPLKLGLTPLLPLDVWEHAYYLKYQNRRPEYIDNWFQVINWQAVEERFFK